MNPIFLSRQLASIVTTTAGHMSEDRVFFAMQAARRLPATASKGVGRVLSRVPRAAAQAAAAWLLGQETKAREIISTATRDSYSRLLGEIALNLGLTEQATVIAEAVPEAAALRSRILWSEGHIDEAIDVLPASRKSERLRSEREVLRAGWWPDVSEHAVARSASRPRSTARKQSASGSRPAASSLHVLTNSLPHTRSGYAYRSHLILRTLQDAGHSAVAVTRSSYPVTIGRLSTGRQERVDGVDYLRHVPLLPRPTPTLRLEEQAERIAELAEERNVDVLHTTTHYMNGLATGSAARAIGLPWVYEVRGVLEETWAAGGNTPAERDARRSSQRFASMRAKEVEVASAADAVITLGETMREHLVSQGVPRESITLIPNSVSESVVKANVDPEPSEVRASLGLPAEGVWVGTAASIVGYEGLDDLIDAVSLARNAGTDIRLFIAGDGVALPALRERAAVLGDNAVFSGRVSQTQAIEYQLGLDMIAVPRKNEPVCRLVTPIKPIEAMGLARPVIISDLPALRELVPDSAGRSVAAEDPQSLADTLSELALDESARLRMGSAGRAHVLETRRWKDIGQRYGHVYSRLVGTGVK
ncbi:glycosyltransferase involved in cell wall biosynthesis [Brevibacterium sanguinis]|uniref:Glycosyltransferase involved in cell wall biosynthesis n=2 Tax=Brevibacterium TaxID=1696 RepID=A0A366IE86_9MICO|nr:MULTISPECIES: glycosyltransferase family 4 protein [Brevibacterium]RBP62935.1 glycosyltransferase involved in cell wall biosynthesis [Brevibacterium sanguinis]RBP69520.1 glycosyltransferase involved in cell wall biosynthesis [Brevibacterium celere]